MARHLAHMFSINSKKSSLKSSHFLLSWACLDFSIRKIMAGDGNFCETLCRIGLQRKGCKGCVWAHWEGATFHKRELSVHNSFFCVSVLEFVKGLFLIFFSFLLITDHSG